MGREDLVMAHVVRKRYTQCLTFERLPRWEFHCCNDIAKCYLKGRLKIWGPQVQAMLGFPRYVHNHRRNGRDHK